MNMKSVEIPYLPWPRSGTPHLLLAMLCLLFIQATATAGSITLIANSPETITHAWAVRWSQDGDGVYAHPTPGVINTQTSVIAFNNLEPGRYILKFQTATGFVEGWDAQVPASDYQIEQPLSSESAATLVQKTQRSSSVVFDDHVAILDMQGNIQNAAILTRQLRTRKFIGGDYKKGEWVFRVTRWQWESPDEQTWAPWQERPSFALMRRRLIEAKYNALRITYARHLGGIEIKTATTTIDLGTLLIPQVQPTIVAVNPDGSVIEPIILKPVASPTDVQAPSSKETHDE